MKNHYAGFTLVELIVTLVVAMVLITVGAPSMKAMYEGIRANSAIESIQSSFQLARSQAVSYGSRVSVCPLSGSSCSGDWRDGYSVFIDNGVLGTLDTTDGLVDAVLTVVNGFNDSDFIKSDFGILSFTPDGLAQRNGNGRLVYCPGSKTSPEARATDVSQSGKIQSIDSGVSCN
jgi:Tfp pilus assembly protein FimT